MRFLIVGILLFWSNSLGVKSMADTDRKKQVQHFLKNISSIESSNGQNLNHPLIQHGIHTGDTAIGQYGLMPNTVNEVLNRMRMNGTITPDLQKLQNMDHNTLKATIEQNPQLEDQIAQSLAQRVLDRQPTEDMAAYSWHQGTNLTPEKIQQSSYLQNPYTQKYNDIDKEDEEDLAKGD